MATTTMEGCFAVAGRAVDIGFVEAALPDEYVADGGVIVVEPVLMLTACVTEDSQGRRLDCVPQMALSVLHGGILVGGRGSDWKVG
nr:unnamed protein product [Spirometra erinaceieuropaei]